MMRVTLREITKMPTSQLIASFGEEKSRSSILGCLARGSQASRRDQVIDWTRMFRCGSDRIVVVTSPFHSSYERGCQEKNSSPSPSWGPRLVDCIQPCLLIRGAFGFTALDRRVFQRRCQPQSLSLT